MNKPYPIRSELYDPTLHNRLAYPMGKWENYSQYMDIVEFRYIDRIGCI